MFYKCQTNVKVFDDAPSDYMVCFINGFWAKKCEYGAIFFLTYLKWKYTSVRPIVELGSRRSAGPNMDSTQAE